MYKILLRGLNGSLLIVAGTNEAWAGEVIPTHQEDGILTAPEVVNFNLRNTDLVVLSACKKGLGGIHRNEEDMVYKVLLRWQMLRIY